MSDTKNTENESGGLKKSLRLIYVYAIAAGAIFTFIGYWDTIFYEYCGAGTFLGFILMTLFSDGYVQEKTGDAAFRKKYKHSLISM